MAVKGLTRKEMMGMMMIKEAQWQCSSRTRKQRSVTRPQTWVSANPPPRWTGTSLEHPLRLDSVNFSVVKDTPQKNAVLPDQSEAALVGWGPVWPLEIPARQAGNWEVKESTVCMTNQALNKRCQSRLDSLFIKAGFRGHTFEFKSVIIGFL